MKTGIDIKPKLSVVVPTLGRRILIKTLNSLIAADGADEIEIIVVGLVENNEVAHELKELISLFPRLKHLPFSFDSGDSSNKKNEGFKESQADIVAFIDDDVVVAENWPNRILEAFEGPDVGMVSGPSLVPDDLPLPARLAGSALASKAAGYVAERYLRGKGGIRTIKWSRIIGCNMAFRREALEKAGGFDTRFWPGEEMVAAFKVAELGHTIVFHPDAFLYHYPRSTILGFIKQIYGYGATRIRLIREGLGLEHSTLVPAIWVLSLVVLGIGAFFLQCATWLLVLSLAFYVVFNVFITILKFLETRKPVDLLIFFVIPLMHLSYGVGEWVEVFRPNKDLSEKAGA